MTVNIPFGTMHGVVNAQLCFSFNHSWAATSIWFYSFSHQAKGSIQPPASNASSNSCVGDFRVSVNPSVVSHPLSSAINPGVNTWGETLSRTASAIPDVTTRSYSVTCSIWHMKRISLVDNGWFHILHHVIMWPRDYTLLSWRTGSLLR